MAAKNLIALIFAGASIVAAPALAQEASAQSGAENGPLANVEPSPDDMADSLNARQQLNQTVTVTRTINGAVVSTETRKLDFDKDGPRRPSEGRSSPLQAAMDSFDAESLTRNEALDEARLDFSLADLNRDGRLSRDEFTAYVLTPTSGGARMSQASDTSGRSTNNETQTARFMAALDAEIASETREENARDLFDMLITRAEAIEEARNPDQKKKSKKDAKGLDVRLFGVAYVEAFDHQDTNADGVLLQDELAAFRAARNGFQDLARKIASEQATAETD